MSSPKVSQCTYCGADIMWAHNAEGKRVPCDALPDLSGARYLFMRNGRLEVVHAAHSGERAARARARARGQNRYMSHYATCENNRR